MNPTIDGSLAGVVVARTSIAHVDGERGTALVRGYLLPELAAKLPYEDVAQLVLEGEVPDDEARARFRAALTEHGRPSDGALGLARGLGEALPQPEALAAAMALLDAPATGSAAVVASTNDGARGLSALAKVPALCAAVAGAEPAPASWPYARRALRALGAQRVDAPAERALEVLLSLEAEHGLSASTFACRVAASSGADAGVSLAAAVATLSGPRHGGATAEARGLLLRALEAGDVGAFAADLHAKRARLPGFGHRVYKVPDPRVPPLRAAMHAMGGARLLGVAEALEREAGALWGQKRVHANIDLFAAALLDALGVAPDRYVAAFALGLAPGWLAHWAEQRATGRLIRPDSAYEGPAQRALP